ncbi:FxsA family protein [Hahella sp. SMD15-11]|uniref:FxsA family protein n=1 Tax=Thermohahella caldifontis TaxID=3142973 RepID=A0AB39UYR4_9GAMM
MPLIVLRLFWWLPLIELVGLIWSAIEIGFLFTFFWTLGTAVWGASLLAGPARIETLQRALHQGQDEMAMMADQLVITLAALCLIFPGWLTDTTGLVLLLPWTRQAVYRRLVEPLWLRMQHSMDGFRAGHPFDDSVSGRTVDGEYRPLDRDKLSKF